MKAGCDPRRVVETHIDEVIKIILEASQIEVSPLIFGRSCTYKQTSFFGAAYSAVRTIAFVAPETVVPRIVEQLKVDINTSAINSLGNDDLAIWKTPEGQTYIDGVLLITTLTFELTSKRHSSTSNDEI